MSKKPVAWHKECLVNWANTIEREMDDVKRRQEALARTRSRYSFYLGQVQEAIHRHKDSFDSERFMVKRISNSDLIKRVKEEK